MTSLRKRYTNRRNAQRCTGPRTAAAKARSAQNARRHGLTRPARADPVWAGAIASLARAIVRAMPGADAEAGCCEWAEQVAVAQIELVRVREARRALYDGAIAAGDFSTIRRLASLERYERRAFSRRQDAIRRLDAARQWYKATAEFGQNETTGLGQNEPPEPGQNETTGRNRNNVKEDRRGSGRDRGVCMPCACAGTNGERMCSWQIRLLHALDHRR